MDARYGVPMTRPAHQPLPRRLFLRAVVGGSLAAGLAGCAPSPLIRPNTDFAPQPAPTLDDSRRRAAQAAADLAALATAAAAAVDATGVFATWCTALAAQHTAHQQVLSQADPLGGVQTDHTPLAEITAADTPVIASQAAAMTLLASSETALAELVSPMLAVGDQPASMTLLWLAQWLAAQVAATALSGGDAGLLGPAPAPGSAVPAETQAGDLADARQVLLSHQQALVFGLQAMLGRIAYDDLAVDVVSARLGEAMRERDQTSAAIVAAGATPTAQPPEFTMPGDVTDPAQRDQIWGQLELAVMAGWARVAAVEQAGRKEASQRALIQAGRARQRGVALPYWPGWV